MMTALLALLAWVGSDLCAQTQPPAKTPPASKQPAKAPAATKPAAQSAPAAKQPAKAAPAAAKQPAKKPPKAKKPQPEKAAGPQPGAETHLARRDPFNPLLSAHRPGGVPERLPPGKAGLVVSTLRVDGIVRGPNGMIAVVSNPQQRVYFLREGDQLFDGKVERISMDGVAFHEVGKDAFGKPVERQVTKRLYPSAGEQP
jgi:hypothetical protein